MNQYQENMYHYMSSRGDGTIVFDAFAFPGGYPILYYDRDNNVLCAECAAICLWSSWVREQPVGAEIFEEGLPEDCCQCGKEIESAYGDPEQNTILDKIQEVSRHNDCVSHCPQFQKRFTNPYDEKGWLISDYENVLQKIREEIARVNTDFWNDLPDSALECITVQSVRAAVATIDREYDYTKAEEN